MAAPPSSSTQWDNRNRAFKPPTLRQPSPSNGYSTNATQSQRTQQQNNGTGGDFAESQSLQSSQGTLPPARSRPATSPSSSTHTRTSSFFSFRKNPSVEDRPMKNSEGGGAATYPNGAQPTSAGSVNEFGSVRSSQYDAQTTSSAPRTSLPPMTRPPPPNPQLTPPADQSRRDSPRPTQQAPLLHPEIRSVLQLTAAHARKVYFSGPLVRRLERQPDGSRPAKDEGWTDVWAQLGGTTLSIWDMKAIADASKEGKEVPPTYINIQDAFVQVLGSVTVPATASAPSKRYTDVLTLNTAGSNLLLFSCPSTATLISWAAALRLSAWEKSRLEEIYTAHLLRISILDVKDAPSPLVKGRLEGWVQIRLAGQTDWKRYYMVVSAGQSLELGRSPSVTSVSPIARNKRISNLFSRDSNTVAGSVLPPHPILEIFHGSKAKDRKVPVLTMREITQVFSMYPERPEMINASTLMKLEGVLGDENAAGGMRSREAWMMVMPEMEGRSPSGEMLKWIMALHDAFELYGRPKTYTWDPRDPISQMFGYPVGPHKDLLFLEREAAETMDPRDDRTSAVRNRLLNILLEKMRAVPGFEQPGRTDGPPSLPPIQTAGLPQQQQQQNGQVNGMAPLLPHLSFESESRDRARGPLTPITERTHESVDYRRPFSGEQNLVNRLSIHGPPPTVAEILGRPVSKSPPPVIPDAGDTWKAAGSSSSVGQSVNNGLPPGAMSTASETASPHPQPVPKRPISPVGASGSRLSHGGPSPGSSPKVSLDQPQRSGSPSQQLQPAKSSSPQYSPQYSILSNPYSTKSVRQPNERPSSPTYLSPSSPAQSDRLSLSLSSGTTSPQSANLGSRQRMIITSLIGPSSDAQTRPGQPPTVSHSRSNSEALSSPSQYSGPTTPYTPYDTTRQQMNLQSSPTDMQDAQSVSHVHRPDQLVTSPLSSNSEFPSPSSQFSSGMTSPYTLQEASRKQMNLMSITNNIQNAQVKPRGVGPGPSTARPSSTEESGTSLFDEAGALYYMKEFETDGQNRRTSTIAEDTDESQSDVTTPKNFPERERSPALRIQTVQTAPVRSGTPGLLDRQMTNASMASSGLGLDGTTTSHGAAPKQPIPRVVSANQNTDHSDGESPSSTGHNTMSERLQASVMTPDDNADALAALSFLEQEASPDQPVVTPKPPPPPPPPKVRTPSPPVETEASAQFRSSFAPSKQAAERKARVQAQEAASHAAAHRPGRANGKRQSTMGVRDGWNQSSDEEEEEDDDDDDADSDAPRPRVQPVVANPVPPGPTQPLQPRPRHGSPIPPVESLVDPHHRPPRNLPPLPGARPGGSEFLRGVSPSRRPTSDQYSESHPRSYYDQGPHIRQQSEAPLPGAAQQNVWSQVLQPGQNPADLNTSNRDTFIQIEPPSQTMTKAFTPHGLLSAGIQDKEDRSAKKQEEFARESGSSLINVPNKPPPPQTGLLGAITAHERERKREGGVGAALTEREREKRMAEERQRKLDEFQRQQLEMAQSGGGSMYQQQQFNGYNPMMANPMMMGMNPMMTGMMGYPGMMPAFANPQHMFAAQQAAAQAYQQAMMTFSQAGSQVGGGGDGAAPPINPMMTGGGMSMFDPRMSMMGMPIMGSPYGMGGPQGLPGQQGMPGLPGMQGMQGMQGGFPGAPSGLTGATQVMSPMDLQNTGGSGFDARFSPNDGHGLHPPSPFQAAQGPPSRNSSPAGRGSPARRSNDHIGIRPSSGHSSPRPSH